MKTKRNRAFTSAELLITITVTGILATLALPACNKLDQTVERQMKGVNNCKQIILSLKQFSKDKGGMYPDSVQNPVTGGLAQSANDAFRFLIQEQIVNDERIFGCPAGYNPDANIGTAPSYGNALMPGENHWAMTAGQTDATVGIMPLVFENPVSASWPPLWNADVAGQIQPGRTWPGGKIIIGRNDGSVAVEALSGDKEKVGPKFLPGGSNTFVEASKGLPERVLPVIYQGAK
ncbi:type II secretion system protein [Prosthecobacter sp.]|uniref:type II secretion system protein n=1 Tax=Prosthecobacter sp. TaxID=1965333 RepID=UPI0037834BCC